MLIGYFAQKVNSLPLVIVFGLLVGGALAFLVAFLGGGYYLEIMLPGSIVGVIVGYTTQRYGAPGETAASV